MTEQRLRAEVMLYEAMAESIGLLVATDDPGRCRQFLYATRTKIGDPDLGRLQFRLVSMDGETRVAIVKSAQLPPAPAYQPIAAAVAPNAEDLDL